MEALRKLNIKSEPLRLEDLQQSVELIVQSFQAASVILQKKVQDKQYLRQNTRIFIPQLLKAEQDINKERKTNINYNMKYVLNGRIIGVVILADLVLYLKITGEPTQDFEIQKLKILTDHGNKIEVGKDIYFGKSVIHLDYMNKGYAKLFYYERIEYLQKVGYTSIYTIAANQKVESMARYLKAKKGRSIVGKYPDNTQYEYPLFIVDINTAMQIIDKYIKVLMPKL